jgi:hypothetical protein
MRCDVPLGSSQTTLISNVNEPYYSLSPFIINPSRPHVPGYAGVSPHPGYIPGTEYPGSNSYTPYSGYSCTYPGNYANGYSASSYYGIPPITASHHDKLLSKDDSR